MNEKDPEKEIFKMEVDVIRSVLGKTAKQAPGSVFGEEYAAQRSSAESLDKKLKSAAFKNEGAARSPERDSSQDIFRAQEEVAEKKHAPRKLGRTVLVVLLVAGIGYLTKLAYEGKLEIRQLSKDYKLLQVTIDAINKRNYELYKKLFPQLRELESSRVDSALLGIEDNLDLAIKLNADADALWNEKLYDQAMELYDRSVKINPLNDRTVYLARETELARQDQEYFKRFYIVQKGDTLESVAARAKVPAQRIINANGPKYTVLYQGRLVRGMQLALPVAIKRVQAGKMKSAPR